MIAGDENPVLGEQIDERCGVVVGRGGAGSCSRASVKSSTAAVAGVDAVAVAVVAAAAAVGGSDSPSGGIGISRVTTCARSGAPTSAMEPTVATIEPSSYRHWSCPGRLAVATERTYPPDGCFIPGFWGPGASVRNWVTTLHVRCRNGDCG